MVVGDIQQVTSHLGLDRVKLVNQRFAGCPCKESTDDVRIDDIWEGVALPREPMNIVSLGLIRLLLAALEILGVTRTDVGPLKVPYKDLLRSAQSQMLLGERNSSQARTNSPK